MATRFEYTKEIKNKVLEELHKGRPKEEISVEFNVPIPVIEKWERNERNKGLVEAILMQRESKKDYKSVLTNLSVFLSGCTTKIKGSWLFFCFPLLIGGFTFGVLNLHNLAHIKGEIDNEIRVDPNIDLGLKVDSLIRVQNDISAKVDKQIEITSEISSNVTINNTYNYPRLRRRPTKKSGASAKKDSCQIIVYCNCGNISYDTIR